MHANVTSDTPDPNLSSNHGASHEPPPRRRDGSPPRARGGIGSGFITLGDGSISVWRAERDYFDGNVAGAKATDGLEGILATAGGMEDEIRQHLRESARLYSQPSQLGW